MSFVALQHLNCAAAKIKGVATDRRGIATNGWIPADHSEGQLKVNILVWFGW